MKPNLLIATRNTHKTREIAQILRKRFVVSDLTKFPDLPEVEETGETFESNAALKACAASLFTGSWALADDSGLEVDALDGAPGVRSARYAGDPTDSASNNALLLKNLSEVRGKERSARFRCTMVLAKAGVLIATFDGRVEGTIINQPKGGGGFGYDPLFVPKGYCETFAELPASVKNQISHRAKALSRFTAWLSANPELT